MPAETGRSGIRSTKPRSVLAGTGSAKVAVLMQGTIVKVLVAPGDEVEVGQSVCVLEAMKMENVIATEKAGTVKEVRVSAGDSVGPGDIVAVID
jgi:acetyl-CoA/propionyl-CoA carboxylase biotin carboxyl carrier protein